MLVIATTKFVFLSSLWLVLCGILENLVQLCPSKVRLQQKHNEVTKTGQGWREAQISSCVSCVLKVFGQTQPAEFKVIIVGTQGQLFQPVTSELP